MIEQEPTVSFPQMIVRSVLLAKDQSLTILNGRNYLSSFESLFDARCSVCERILSQEGHVPLSLEFGLTVQGEGSVGTLVTSLACMRSNVWNERMQLFDGPLTIRRP